MPIRRRTLAFLLAGLAAACSAPPPRAATPDRPSAAASAPSIDMRRLLPAPFATGSNEARAELDQMLAIQAARTPASAARARADADASVFRFADALGSPPAFAPERLPLVSALFARVLEAEGGAIVGAKDGFDRTRPCRAEPRLEPVLPCPTNGSYPSGHAAFGWAAALVLADLVPERRAAILARAREFAWNRVVAGVHYPSDVEAGRITGIVVAAFLFASPQFQAEERAARHELRAALGLPAEAPNG
jgi:acid phosphatase (class A)